MPYNSSSDEYFWGTSFARDGSDWNPNAPRPKLSDAYRVLNRTGSDLFQITVVGKIYKGKSEISGVSGVVDIMSIKGAIDVSLTGKAISHGGGGYSLEDKVKILLGLTERPTKITGIYFRPLD